MFMITTTDGTRVFAGADGKGITQAQAQSSADERNARAQKLGVEARYVAKPFEAVK